jgi:hypothetical protein
MLDKGKKIATVHMEIAQEHLKEIVESGRIMEFADKASLLAAEELRVQIHNELAKSALSGGLSKALTLGVAVSTGDDLDFIVVGPKPHPIPSGVLETAAMRVLAGAVAAGMVQYNTAQAGTIVSERMKK